MGFLGGAGTKQQHSSLPPSLRCAGRGELTANNIIICVTTDGDVRKCGGSPRQRRQWEEGGGRREDNHNDNDGNDNDREEGGGARRQ